MEKTLERLYPGFEFGRHNSELPIIDRVTFNTPAEFSH